MGSASPKESHFGRSFHTSSVMCFQTEACTCNRSLASVLLASQKTPTIDSCRTHISTGFNWLRFTILLAERIVNGHLKDLTSDQRADCFVFDDSLYSRTGYKKTELAAKVFDHVSMTYKKGFRMMTMGWTDGSSQSLHHSCPQRTIRMSSGRPRRSTSAQSRPRGGLWHNQRGPV